MARGVNRRRTLWGLDDVANSAVPGSACGTPEVVRQSMTESQRPRQPCAPRPRTSKASKTANMVSVVLKKGESDDRRGEKGSF